MRIYIAAVGKLKEGPERELCQRYLKRMTWSVQILEAADESHLWTLAPEKTCKILLDETGKQLSSPEFAQKVSKIFETYSGGITFFIGGAEGVSAAMLQKVDMVLSLGAMTWPHLLVRGLLIEQLYRAQQILKNHPYHKI